MLVNISIEEMEVLIDLESRLIKNYNNDCCFIKHEEDRLIIGNIIDIMLKGRSKK